MSRAEKAATDGRGFLADLLDVGRPVPAPAPAGDRRGRRFAALLDSADHGDELDARRGWAATWRFCDDLLPGWRDKEAGRALVALRELEGARA